MTTAPIEISEHLHRVFLLVKEAQTWLTAREIAAGADVSYRTARGHAAKLAVAGVFDVQEVFGGYRYRLTAQSDKRNKSLVQRIEQAGAVFNSTINQRG